MNFKRLAELQREAAEDYTEAVRVIYERTCWNIMPDDWEAMHKLVIAIGAHLSGDIDLTVEDDMESSMQELGVTPDVWEVLSDE